MSRRSSEDAERAERLVQLCAPAGERLRAGGRVGGQGARAARRQVWLRWMRMVAEASCGLQRDPRLRDALADCQGDRRADGVDRLWSPSVAAMSYSKPA